MAKFIQVKLSCSREVILLNVGYITRINAFSDRHLNVNAIIYLANDEKLEVRQSYDEVRDLILGKGGE